MCSILFYGQWHPHGFLVTGIPSEFWQSLTKIINKFTFKINFSIVAVCHGKNMTLSMWFEQFSLDIFAIYIVITCDVTLSMSIYRQVTRRHLDLTPDELAHLPGGEPTCSPDEMNAKVLKVRT